MYSILIQWFTWHPKGPVFAVGTEDAQVLVYHAQNTDTFLKFYGHAESVSCGQFTHDGKLLITASEDTSVRVWDLKFNKLMHTIKSVKFHKAPISAMALAKEKSIIATGSFENEIAISNYETAGVLLSLTVGKEGNSIENIAFCNEDKFVVFAGTDNRIQILDLNTLNIRTNIELGEEGISRIQPSMKNQYIVYLGSTNGYFYIFDVRGNGEFTQSDKVHKDIVMDFVITSDEKFAITASIDKTINLVKMIDIN